MKAIWKGSISLGLINIPVKLYSATEESSVKFREIHSKCGTPLEHKRWCPKCKVEVPWNEVEKGFEISTGVYVPITQEELNEIKLKGIKSIELIGFINENEIPTIYLDKHYFLGPQEDKEIAYFILKKALKSTGKVAIGRLVIRSKERIIIIKPYKDGLLLTTLFYNYEIRDIEKIDFVNEKININENQIEMAKELINSYTKKFDMSKYKDRFAEALKGLIEKKIKGEKIEVKEKEEETKPFEEALKEMLKKIKENETNK